ncbi:MAG: DUF4197 domain-containing protein [Pseudomonadota bacterium]
MTTRNTLINVLMLGALILYPPLARAGIGDFLRDVQKSLSGSELPESRVVQGLKEALETGTANAVKTVSKTGGYFDNSRIRIPLPGPVKKVEKVLQAVGYGPQVDAFERSMNLAAEQAAPHAKSLFWDAIKAMNFDDARRILKGRENEATLYFEEKIRDRLTGLFKPLVHKTMADVGVTRQYQALDAKVRSLPFTDALQFDLDKYVTDRGLDGLFLMLAEEERKIRQDPAARVTDLLKEVFGGK